MNFPTPQWSPILESPLEALIFRYSTTLAGYIWTCLALFTAAVSLWHLRLLGSGSRSEFPAASAPAPSDAAASTPSMIPPAILDCDNTILSQWSTKGKFTAYILGEIEDIDGRDELTESEEWVRRVLRIGADRWDCLNWRWESDDAWYSYQDRMAINGSVVKLWDCHRRGFPATTQRTVDLGVKWGF